MRKFSYAVENGTKQYLKHINTSNKVSAKTQMCIKFIHKECPNLSSHKDSTGIWFIITLYNIYSNKILQEYKQQLLLEWYT
jgi:hypothetical protein